MPTVRHNHCFAPGCRTGYSRVKGVPKTSIFNVPQDEARRKQWEKNLHRGDKKLQDKCAVCELLIEPHFVIGEYIHTIDRKEACIPRGRPTLSEDAVLTILPNLPAYLSKWTPKPRNKRKVKQEDQTTSSKKIRTTADAPSTENEPNGQSRPKDAETFCASEGTQGTASSDEVRENSNFLLHLKAPECWTKHCFPNLDGVLYCTSTLCEEATVVSEKVLIFFRNTPHVAHSKVSMRGRLVAEEFFSSQDEAERLLQIADAFDLCVGALNGADYPHIFFDNRNQESAEA